MQPNNCMNHSKVHEDMEDLSENFPEIDSSLWTEPPLAEGTSVPFDFCAITDESHAQYPFNSAEIVEPGCHYGSIIDEGMEFWYNLLISPELSEFWALCFYVAAVLGPLTKRKDFSFKGGDGLLSKSKSLVTLITESAIDELKADLGNELVKAYEEVP